MKLKTAIMTCGLALPTYGSVVHAQEAVGLSVSADASGVEGSAVGPEAEPDVEAEAGPIHHPIELGLFGGVLFSSTKHDLHEDDMKRFAYEKAALDVGLRLAYLPSEYFGVEGEGALMPTATRGDGASALLMALRAHVLLQLPSKHITPFLVAGGGTLGADSDTNGKDFDWAAHFGAGVKLPLTDRVSARLDVRDTISKKHEGGDGYPHQMEILMGLGFGFGGSAPPPPPPPPDSDGDGVLDMNDECPMEFGATPNGCPIRDTDGDGKLDPDDACPTEAGTLENGCPDLDTDKDNVPVPTDECPDVAGTLPNGCPDMDPDKDGIAGEADKCPTEPETRNGYEDTDGCPDEVPEKIKEFTGVIEGIQFDTGKSTIRATSFGVLDRAASVLTEFPTLRLEITGHTDSTGSHDMNVSLSDARAAAVKTYLLGKGVKDGQLVTRGVGPDSPIADNATAVGRQQNRRIEFKILQ